MTLIEHLDSQLSKINPLIAAEYAAQSRRTRLLRTMRGWVHERGHFKLYDLLGLDVVSRLCGEPSREEMLQSFIRISNATPCIRCGKLPAEHEAHVRAILT